MVSQPHHSSPQRYEMPLEFDVEGLELWTSSRHPRQYVRDSRSTNDFDSSPSFGSPNTSHYHGQLQPSPWGTVEGVINDEFGLYVVNSTFCSSMSTTKVAGCAERIFAETLNICR